MITDELVSDFLTGKYSLKELGEKHGYSSSHVSILISEHLKNYKIKPPMTDEEVIIWANTWFKTH